MTACGNGEIFSIDLGDNRGIDLLEVQVTEAFRIAPDEIDVVAAK